MCCLESFAILKELNQRPDVIVGLATGNIESGARIKLERGGLNGYFSFGGFGSDSERRSDLVRKAAERAADKNGGVVSPSNTFVLGDTILDIEAGKQAGFKTVGVATGSYSVDQLMAAGATFAVQDLEQERDYFFSLNLHRVNIHTFLRPFVSFGMAATFSTTSIPSTTRPNTVYVLSSAG